MNRFWLSWYAFVIHTLMFLMVCGGHVFASEPSSVDTSPTEVLLDAAASFVCADHSRHGCDDGHLFGESDPTEEVEESEHSERIATFVVPPVEPFWFLDFASSYDIERQRGRAPPRPFLSSKPLHPSRWFAATRPSRGPPSYLLA